MITVVCWNIDGKHDSWRQLIEMDADVAVLQEARKPPKDVAPHVEVGPTDHWGSIDYPTWPLIARLSDRVKVDWFTPVPPARVGTGKAKNVRDPELAVSDATTIAAARIRPVGGEPFIAVSMYARWLNYHPFAIADRGNSTIHSDASMHRIISDLSVFIRHQDPSTHRILLAGDMNAFYGELHHRGNGKPYRETSAFDRLHQLGFAFMGPQQPDGRGSSCGLDKSLPTDTRNVATRRVIRKERVVSENQLDYVFASCGFHKSIHTRALNEVDEWGASDHCRILVEVG